MPPSQSSSPVDTIREESADHRPPRDPRNVWRVLAANGWSREVASEGNARQKAAGYDEVCPVSECPHQVQHWTGSEWVSSESPSVLHLYAGETCSDCAEHIERERHDLPGLTGAPLHLAVGALYGGSACDHVDYDDSDAARAMEALWSYANRQRDALRSGMTAMLEAFLHEYGDRGVYDFLVEHVDKTLQRAGLQR